jgi:hypothetical protein
MGYTHTLYGDLSSRPAPVQAARIRILVTHITNFNAPIYLTIFPLRLVFWLIWLICGHNIPIHPVLL